MAIADEQAVRRILADFELRLCSILEQAWEAWLAVPNRGIYSARSRASMVFDHVKQNALADFAGDPNIRAIPEGQTVKFLFRDTVLIRFKKAGPAGIGSNIETQAVLQFVVPQADIPGLLPDIYKVEICYHLNKLETGFEQIAVTARERRKKLWSYEIGRQEAADVPAPTFMPDGGAPQPPDVRPRQPAEKKKQNEE